MAHKVHPKAFRLQKLENWLSRWFEKRKLADYLEEDFMIREFLEKKIGQLGVEKIEIERSANKINIIISTARPGLLIGRSGRGVEELKKQLVNRVIKKETGGPKEVKIEIRELKDVWSSAVLLAKHMAQQIEKRTPYRRVLKQALAKAMSSKQVKGVRVEVAGRLDGNEIARREWLQKGRLPRQTIRADIDFAQATAYCSYGTVGVKVWIYKGEKFE
ncbi:MAG: 30S ribosomal protein S3 [Minisyncoccales bacterium]